MAVYQVFGQRLISEDDLLRKALEISNPVLKRTEALTFSAGQFTANDLAPMATSGSRQVFTH